MNITILLLLPSFAVLTSTIAQDITLPLQEQVRSVPIQMPNGTLLTTTYAVASEKQLIYFAPIVLTDAQLDGMNFVDTNTGLVREPNTNSTLVLNFYEPLKEPIARAEYLNTLRNHPEVTNELPFLEKLIPASMQQPRVVSIACRDETLRVVNLLESELPDRDNRSNTKVSLRIPADCIPLFQNRRADDLDVVVKQIYRARFQTNQVEFSLSSLKTEFGRLDAALVPSPTNRLAGLLLSTDLPIGAVQSGNLSLSKNLNTFLSQHIRLQLLVRAGSTVDESLLGTLFDHILRQSEFLSSQTYKDDTVVTLLTKDGLQISTALGTITKLNTARTTELEKRLQSAIINSLKNKGKFEVINGIIGGATAVTLGFPGIAALGAGAADKLLGEWDDSRIQQENLEEYFRDFQKVDAWVEGEIPYLPGISFNDRREAENINFSEIEGSIGSFTVGSGAHQRTQSFAALAGRQEAVSILDQLLVQRVEMGEFRRDKFQQETGEYNAARITVSFKSRFLEPPVVIAGLNEISPHFYSPVDAGLLFSTRLTVTEATVTNFVLTISTPGYPHPDTIGVSWTAAGKVSVRDALAAQPSIRNSISANVLGLSVKDLQFTPPAPPLIEPLRIIDGSMRIAFKTEPGLDYRLDASTNLVDWSTWDSIVPASFRTVLDYDTARNGDKLFIRVVPLSPMGLEP